MLMRILLNAAHRGLHRLAGQRHDHRSHEADPGGMGISGEAYDRLSGRLLSGIYRRAADDVCRAPQGALVLDIGTGPGRLLLDIARRRPDLRPHGVDVSASMTERARHNMREHGYGDRVTIHLAEAGALPLPDASADAVVSTLSMHHWADVPEAVTEMARVLRPGGRIVIYDFRATSDEPLNRTVAARPEFAGRTVRRTLVTGTPWIPLPLFARMTVERA
ncbi:class I SAM-dependent methyltransferase [Streptomyces sp. NPDC091289]|uniref:class I SAM-dependent methyltransferase n=1 Tax=Streptomyces sp. NPDC091289 TaxID=3365989 RepID=UPI0037F73FF9